MVMMGEVNKWSGSIAIVFSLLKGNFFPMMGFILTHKALMIDLMMSGLLAVMGQMFIYRLVKQFRQHMVPFIITSRKVFTVGISIMYYNHKMSYMQGLGLGIVLAMTLY